MIEKHCTKILLLILFLTTCVYSSSFGNEFLNYDDLLNVSQNIYIRQINTETLKVYFTRPLIVMYTPLVYLSYAIDYAIGGLNPFIYHLTNLLLHLTNIVLVFYLVRSLTKKDIAGLCASVLFAVHPMNVAAVTPISVRSSLLYSAFFLGAYISYIKYCDNEHNPLYWAISLFLFILSVLSKSMAVVLPVLFLLTDLYRGRKMNKKAVMEKLPFLAVSIAFGILTLIIRKEAIAAQVAGRLEYTLLDRLILTHHATIAYLVKLMVPLDLLAFNNYPVKAGGWLPLKYYLSLIPGILLVCGLLVLRKYRKAMLFPLAFFLINIVLVIKIVPVGFEMTADRYVYIAYLGFFFAAGIWLNDQLEKQQVSGKRLIAGGFIVVIAVFSVLSYQRSKDWHDSIRFWNKVIEQFESAPGKAFFNKGAAKTDIKELPGARNDLMKAYLRRGTAKVEIYDYQGAVHDFTKAIEFDPDQAVAYNNRCLAELHLQDLDAALKDCSRAIELDPSYSFPYANRGKIRHKQGFYEEAIRDLSEAIMLAPELAESYSSRGSVKLDMNDHQGAVYDFTKAIALAPYNPAAYNDRCLAELIAGDLDAALKDCSKAIELDPKLAVAYVNRADILYNLGSYREALHDVSKAIGLDPRSDAAYFIRANIKYRMGDSKGAIEDYSTAATLNATNPIAYFNRGTIRFRMNDVPGACADWKAAANLGYSAAKGKVKKYCR